MLNLPPGYKAVLIMSHRRRKLCVIPLSGFFQANRKKGKAPRPMAFQELTAVLQSESRCSLMRNTDEVRNLTKFTPSMLITGSLSFSLRINFVLVGPSALHQEYLSSFLSGCVLLCIKHHSQNVAMYRSTMSAKVSCLELTLFHAKLQKC